MGRNRRGKITSWRFLNRWLSGKHTRHVDHLKRQGNFGAKCWKAVKMLWRLPFEKEKRKKNRFCISSIENITFACNNFTLLNKSKNEFNYDKTLPWCGVCRPALKKYWLKEYWSKQARLICILKESKLLFLVSYVFFEKVNFITGWLIINVVEENYGMDNIYDKMYLKRSRNKMWR